ncbi:MAG: hypothetical protein LBR24_02325 [Methanobrevibacter sp.]|nr:hypothetical protein [Methanobrevibacter sp.]
MIIIFQDYIKYKNKKIPKTLLGTAPFTAESYFGHRSRLYQLDLLDIPENIAKVIKSAIQTGVKGINLNTNPQLLKGYEIAINNGVKMDVVGIIGKTEVNYIFPNWEEAKNADWKADLKTISKYNPEIVLVDEFIVDSYDWELLEEILNEIKNQKHIPGLITSFPYKTTEKLLDSPIKNLFDFYMIPVNKLGYMMDTESFLEEDKDKLKNMLKELNKKIIINKMLAAGIQQPKEAFNFLKTLDYPDIITIGVSSEKEAEEDFELLFNME